MVVTSAFTFIHLHKSAGTFVNNFIARFFKEIKIIGYHIPARFIPQEFHSLPIIGCIRNPWDFYVSWYFFQLQKQQSSPLFLTVSDDKTRDFNGTMERLLSLNENEKLLVKIINQIPNNFVNSGMNVPGHILGKILGTDVGLYSYLYQWMFFDAHSAPTVLKIEDFPSALEKILISLDFDISPEMGNYLLSGVHANKSSHSHYSKYYSKEIADRVMILDKTVIENYEYGYTDKP